MAAKHGAKQESLLVRRTPTNRGTDWHLPSDLYYVGVNDLDGCPGPVYRLTQGLKNYNGDLHYLDVLWETQQVAFLKRKDQEKPWENVHLFIIDLQSSNVSEWIPNLAPKHLQLLEPGREDKEWTLCPSDIGWGPDGDELYCLAEDRGYSRLSRISVSWDADKQTLVPTAPTMVCVSGGSVDKYFVCGKDEKKGTRLFVGTSSFLVKSATHVVYPDTEEDEIFWSVTDAGSILGPKESQISEFWFTGSGDYSCHSWMIKPSFFSDQKKYPVYVAIHGGPASAWINEWTDQDNPFLLAEQGYIIILPNITGSTGFGSDFEKPVYENEIDQPYQDLVKCWEYVERSFKFCDVSKAVCCGSSYGGM